MKSKFTALIFDMDGTITVPILNFKNIRKEINIMEGDLTDEIKKLSPGRQQECWDIIEKHEKNAMKKQRLQEGTKELLEQCKKMSLKIGLLTRNRTESVTHLCQRFDISFDSIISREYPYIKPNPKPILHMLEVWKISPEKCLMTGDYIHDIECGNAAGTQTCFFQNPQKPDFGKDAHYTVKSMRELQELLFA
ncbi:MAG: HAD-IA family hydrolase [Verrucomicrobiota bacterium]|nr:HAD-IA family hydrolase [Verrucomicrobiota bacterium]